MLRGRSACALAGAACVVFTLLGTEQVRAAEKADLTFYRDILPIFQRHCVECHHEGGSAPLSLESHDLGRTWFRTSKQLAQDKEMPPWQADPKVGQWKNADALTDEEIETIATWVDGGLEAGEPSDGPAPLDFSNPWLLGGPDRIFEMAEAYSIPAKSPDVYRAFVLSPAMESDTWLSAIELSPGDPRAVMHMSLSAAPAGVANRADEAAEGPGFPAFDRGWAEGTKDHLAIWNRGMTLVEPFPEGTGVLIPQGWNLVLLVHYVAGEEEDATDRSKVGIYLAEGAPDREMLTMAVEERDLSIPGGSYFHKVTAELTLEKSITVHGILPRMHYFGESIELIAHRPDGTDEKVIKIRRFNYKMETRYTPVEPIVLPAGTRLEAVAFYENNYDNPNNPNLTVSKAGYGPGPKNEILSVVLQYTEE